jgi:NTE family protein
MLSYGDKTDFDDLPIPFRAVATDLVNAETVVLKDGSLAQSLRATMAIPGVFAPVELNGKILADGGILNNIPTDVANRLARTLYRRQHRNAARRPYGAAKFGREF